MQKRGQFYLVAAIIIVGILVSSVAVVNYSRKMENVFVGELKNELKIETQKVLEYDEVHSGGEQIRNFGTSYSSYRSEAKFYFISGDSQDINAYEYSKGVETQLSDPLIENEKIIFTLNNLNYEFDLTPSKNFYFVVSQETNGENYIVTG